MIQHPMRNGRSGLLARFRKQKLTIKALIVLFTILAIGFIFSIAVFAWYARDLPSPGRLSQATSASTIFLDRDDKVLFELSKDKNRVPVELKDISENLKKATVAIEDKNFYKHKGVSQVGIIRAAFSTLSGKGLQGGSTITQQLIKNTLLGPQRTLPRKFKEVILATEVERRYSKDEILEMYLNEAPYGGVFWGVESASMGYFGKPAKELNVLESAFIAGLPQAPSTYSPFIGKQDAWKGRTEHVLRRMREDKYITKEEEKKALNSMDKLTFSEPKLSINAPHFVFYVSDLIAEEYGDKILDQGLKVKTTLSLELQREMQDIVREEIEELEGYNVGNGAAVVIDSQSGEVLAMVGSYDFNNEDYGKFNAATSQRQPGSALKPITYATAFEEGYTPSTVVMDLQTEFYNGAQEAYVPVNYDNKFRGPVQLRFALANSYNVPAVKLLAMIGVKDFLRQAYDMGLSSLEPTDENMSRFGLSVTLGGGEVSLLDLTSAYSVFARGGLQKDTQPILEIHDYRGKRIFKKRDIKEERVLSEESSFLISHILSDNVARTEAFGANSYLHIPGSTVAVKTGTTDDKRDNWTVGYTTDVTAGVWVGNNDNSPMNSQIASGLTGASSIWNKVMNRLLEEYEDGIPSKPDKVVSLEIDAFLGGLPKDGYPTRSEYFIKGSEPTEVSSFYKKLKLSKTNNKLANEVETRAGNYDEKEFVVITEEDPISPDDRNRWQEAIDKWRKEQSDEKYKYPTETSDASLDDVAITITEPKGETTIGNSLTVRAKIASVEPIKNVKIYLNDEEKKNFDGDVKSINESFNVPDGTYAIKVTAENEKGKKNESIIYVGVNKPWDED